MHSGMCWCCAHISVSGNGPDWYDSRAIEAKSGARSRVAPLERRRADNRAFSASFGPLVPHQTKPKDAGCIPACVGAALTSVSVGMGRTGVKQAANRAEKRLLRNAPTGGLCAYPGAAAGFCLFVTDLRYHDNGIRMHLHTQTQHAVASVCCPSVIGQ